MPNIFMLLSHTRFRKMQRDRRIIDNHYTKYNVNDDYSPGQWTRNSRYLRDGLISFIRS